MKIALIDASPRPSSHTKHFLEQLQSRLPSENHCLFINMKSPTIDDKTIADLMLCDCWVIGFPLYVDAVPAHLLSVMEILGNSYKDNSHNKISVYSLVNCGFYEGHQTAIAMQIMRNWCDRYNFAYAQSLGIGGGGMLGNSKHKSFNNLFSKDLQKGLDCFVQNIEQQLGAGDIFVSPNFPRFLYKFAGEAGWKSLAKKNGLKVESLYDKP